MIILFPLYYLRIFPYHLYIVKKHMEQILNTPSLKHDIENTCNRAVVEQFRGVLGKSSGFGLIVKRKKRRETWWNRFPRLTLLHTDIRDCSLCRTWAGKW